MEISRAIDELQTDKARARIDQALEHVGLLPESGGKGGGRKPSAAHVPLSETDWQSPKGQKALGIAIKHIEADLSRRRVGASLLLVAFLALIGFSCWLTWSAYSSESTVSIKDLVSVVPTTAVGTWYWTEERGMRRLVQDLRTLLAAANR